MQSLHHQTHQYCCPIGSMDICFNSSPAKRSSSTLTSSGGSSHFAVLRNSLIWLALGPPTSSVPGVATPFASVSPKAFKARETCCWSGSYSIHHCRNVSVLPKRLTVRDCDDSGPRVTTLLDSYALRNKLSACFRSSRRPTMKKSSPAPECRFASLYGRSGTEKPRHRKVLPPPTPEHSFLTNVGQHQKEPYIVFRNFPHTPGCFALGSSSGNRT